MNEELSRCRWVMLRSNMCPTKAPISMPKKLRKTIRPTTAPTILPIMPMQKQVLDARAGEHSGNASGLAHATR